MPSLPRRLSRSRRHLNDSRPWNARGHECGAVSLRPAERSVPEQRLTAFGDQCAFRLGPTRVLIGPAVFEQFEVNELGDGPIASSLEERDRFSREPNFKLRCGRRNRLPRPPAQNASVPVSSGGGAASATGVATGSGPTTELQLLSAKFDA